MKGDMAALGRLRAAVEVGWHLETRYGSSRDGDDRGAVVTELPDNVYAGGPGYRAALDRPTSNQGRRYTTTWGRWPVEGDDFEVQERDQYDRPVWVLHIYRERDGRRYRLVSVEFKAPDA